MTKMIIVEPDAKVNGLGVVFRCIDEVVTGSRGCETCYRRTPTGYSNGVNALHSEGLKIINAAQLAYARLNTFKERPMVVRGTFLQECAVYLPECKHRIYLIRKPDAYLHECLQQQDYVSYNEKGRREEIVHSMEKYLESLPYEACLPLSKKDIFDKTDHIKYRISTKEFGKDIRTSWLFGELAEEYGLFLRQSGEGKEIRFNLITLSDRIDRGYHAEMHPLFHFGSIGFFSVEGFGTEYIYLSDSYVCGVRADTPDQLQDVPKRCFVGQPERITLKDMIRHIIFRSKISSANK